MGVLGLIRAVKYSLLLGILLVAVICTLSTTFALSNDWLTGEITLHEEKTYILPQDISILDSIGTNSPDCATKQIKTSYTQIASVCMYNFGAGSYGNGFLLFNNAKIAGSVKSQMSTSSKLIFTTDQRVVELVSVSGGYRIYVYDSLSGITITKLLNGTITYTLPNNPRLIKYSDGSMLLINYNTFKLSESNDWAVADTLGYIGFVRINIASGEVYSFTDTFNDYYALNAISDDGMYASLSTQAPQKRLLVYDLSNCTKQSTLVNRCKSVDILQKIQLQKPSFYSVVHAPSFINNNLLKLYGTYDRINAGDRKIGIFTVSPNGQSLTKTNYLALGDSFSSGEGVKSYRPETDFADNRCHQSLYSYGYLLHDLIPNSGTFGSVACSGAKIKDIVLSGYSSEDEYNRKGYQAKNKTTPSYDTDIIDYFLPGYRLQTKFLKEQRPQIITMSMGGNDIGFSDILKKCVLSFGYNDCYQTYEDRKELTNMINAQYPRLRDMYDKLKKEAAPNAKIYIIGYPQIAKSSGNCAPNVHFSEDEIVFGNQLISYLNYVIKSAASDSGVFYVDVENSFEGHRLCETSSYDVAVNGLSFGNGGPINGVGPIAKESYHPNKLGHVLFANSINGITTGLSAPMPNGNPTASLVVPSDTNIPLLATAPHSNRTLKTLQYMQNISTEVAIKSALLNIQIAQPFVFKPSSSVKVSIHSDPVDLGSFTTDTNGGLDGPVTIPDSIPAGYHTLYIEGKNMAEEDIAVTEIIYVASSQDDMDGDGVIDSQQACVGITPSGVDVDKDGLDDACDDFIDQAPPEPENPPVDENPVQPTDNPQDQGETTPPEQTPPEVTPPTETTNPPVEITPPTETQPVIVDEPIPPAEVIPPEKLNDSPPTAQQNTIINTPVATAQISQSQPVQTSVRPTNAPSNTQPLPSKLEPSTSQTQSITKVAGISTPAENTSPVTKTNNQSVLLISSVLGFFALFGIVLAIIIRAR